MCWFLTKRVFGCPDCCEVLTFPIRTTPKSWNYSILEIWCKSADGTRQQACLQAQWSIIWKDNKSNPNPVESAIWNQPPKTKKQFTTDQCGCARGFELKQIIAAVKYIFFIIKNPPFFPKRQYVHHNLFLFLWMSSPAINFGWCEP